MTLQVELVSPELILYSGEADMVICRTLQEGELAFLTGHTPFLGALDDAPLRIKKADGNWQDAAVHGGFVEVSDDRVIILSDLAELAEDIDVERARRELAENERRTQDHDDAEVEAKLRRDHVRILVAENRH